MRRLPVFLLVPALLAAAPAGLETIQATEKPLQEAVQGIALDGAFWVPQEIVKAGRALPPKLRGEAGKLLVELARRYTESPAFKEKYAAGRNDLVPPAPRKPRTADELQAAAKAEFAQSLKDAEEAIKQAPPEMRGELKKMLEQSREQAREASESRAAFEEQAKLEKLRYAEELLEQKAMQARMSDEVPADPRAAVRARLRTLLAETADVKFDAKLVDEDGRKYFADAELEGRSSEWKMCFRAGREACSAARAAAQAWLEAMGK